MPGLWSIAGRAVGMLAGGATAALWVTLIWVPFGGLSLDGIGVAVGAMMALFGLVAAIASWHGHATVVFFCFVASFFGVGSFALSARRRPVVSGREALIGATAAVTTVEGAHMWVQLHGEYWQARIAAPNPLPVPGTPVRVVAVDGLTLVVEPDAATTPT